MSDVDVDRDVSDCDVAVDDVNPVVDAVVVGFDVELVMLSVVVVTGIEVVGVSVKVRDDEADEGSTDDVSMAVVTVGVSVDVTMEIGVVTTVGTGGAESVDEIVSMVSVGV